MQSNPLTYVSPVVATPQVGQTSNFGTGISGNVYKSGITAPASISMPSISAIETERYINDQCSELTLLKGQGAPAGYVLSTSPKGIEYSKACFPERYPDEMEDESDLKKRYKVAAGDKLVVREENYAKPIFPEPKSDDFDQGWMYRYFCKQSNNPYGDIIEIDAKQYRSAGSKNSGLDGSHYEVIRVQWVISGDIKEVEGSNTRIADFIEKRHPKMFGLRRVLYDNLLKHWDGSKK